MEREKTSGPRDPEQHRQESEEELQEKQRLIRKAHEEIGEPMQKEIEEVAETWKEKKQPQ